MKTLSQRQIDAICYCLTMKSRTAALKAAGYSGKPKPKKILPAIAQRLKPILEEYAGNAGKS